MFFVPRGGQLRRLLLQGQRAADYRPCHARSTAAANAPCRMDCLGGVRVGRHPYLAKAQTDDQRQEQQREAAHIVIEVAEATARQQQQALADSLWTPAAFIAKCGGRTHRRSGASAWDLTGTGLERSAYEALVYSKSPTSMDVIFTQDKDFPVL